VSWQSDWEIRTIGRSLIPDAVFSVRWRSGVLREYTLGVDNETRSSRAFLHKILQYTRTNHTTIRVPEPIRKDNLWWRYIRPKLPAVNLSLLIMSSLPNGTVCKRIRSDRSICQSRNSHSFLTSSSGKDTSPSRVAALRKRGPR
jgi:hypothetical protein